MTRYGIVQPTGAVQMGGGGNGYPQRQAFIAFADRILDNAIETVVTKSITTPTGVVVMNFELGV